jgi:RHH-type rel operon transcriptional repressor/antitoxin RelB
MPARPSFNARLLRFGRALLYISDHEGSTSCAQQPFTVRVDVAAKKRLERLAKSTGRSRSFLAAEAIKEYLDVNEWQIAGIKQAIASLDRGEGVSHEQVKDWITSWRILLQKSRIDRR